MLADKPLQFLVSTTGCAGDIRRHMGSADYSYAFVLKALTPVLDQLGTWRLIGLPESSLAFAAHRAAAEGSRPIHLALHPPQNGYFTPAVPTVLFPFWEFPRIPDRDFGHDTRQNWSRMCRGASLILTACRFTAEAIRRAGINCPVEVVPVPLPPEPFALPAWDGRFTLSLDCRHLILGGDPSGLTLQSSVAPAADTTPFWKRGLRGGYRRYVRRWLNDEAIERISNVRKTILQLPEEPPPLLPVGRLDVSGLVYTSIFNFSDRRKNAEDLLSAFLIAFGDRPDVTLVLKLATSPAREFFELRELRALYESMGLRHRCRLVVITDFLSDAQMLDLLRATTYYVNVSRAEGACLPLQQALAAGRPALAPDHTALADYMDERLGFVIAMHEEPTFWPHDPDQRLETSWRRLVWSDLRDHFLRSADLVANDRDGYGTLAAAARARMSAYAARPVVVEALRSALGRLDDAPIGALDWAC
jgi:glycosyltransferase involved in cell wall biosynthesis